MRGHAKYLLVFYEIDQIRFISLLANSNLGNVDLWRKKTKKTTPVKNREGIHFSSSNYVSWSFTPAFQLLTLKNEYTISLPRFVAALQRGSMKNISRRTSQGDIPVDPGVRVTIKRPPCFIPMSWWSEVRGHEEHGYVHSQRGWRVMEWQIQAKWSNLRLSHLNLEENRKTWICSR